MLPPDIEGGPEDSGRLRHSVRPVAGRPFDLVLAQDAIELNGFRRCSIQTHA